MTFNRNDDKRNVNVNRNDNDWNDNWWFGGVRKSFYSPRCFGEFIFAAVYASRPAFGQFLSAAVTDE